ncbi:MAG: HNH endonuclease [Oscillospiraceae bacterium]
MCRVCLENGIYCSGDLSVHHITPIASDYSKRLDDDNLITLCSYHHEAAEKGEISAEHLRSLAEHEPL